MVPLRLALQGRLKEAKKSGGWFEEGFGEFEDGFDWFEEGFGGLEGNFKGELVGFWIGELIEELYLRLQNGLEVGRVVVLQGLFRVD